MITSTRARRELYDMTADPGETQDLWSSRPEVALDLEQQLEEADYYMVVRASARYFQQH